MSLYTNSNVRRCVNLSTYEMHKQFTVILVMVNNKARLQHINIQISLLASNNAMFLFLYLNDSLVKNIHTEAQKYAKAKRDSKLYFVKAEPTN